MSEKEPHVDVSVNTKQAMTLPVLLQLVTLLSAVAVTYSTMTANDREHSLAIAQLQRDLARVEKDAKDLKVDILTELREIRTELRERQKGSK